ncbi:MAG: glycosyltransferase family 4 protein [Deltaproteobacteria bacterium]
MKNIWIINHYAGSISHGMEYRPYYFAKEWVKAGHHVTIVGSSFSHVRSLQPICNSAVSFEEIDGIHYVWYRAPRYSGNSFKRIVNMLLFSFQLLTRNILATKPDIVIDSSTYPLTIWGSHKIAKRFNAKLIFEVHDLWPLTPMELGGYSPWHPFILLLQQAENYAYKNADKVVSLLPCAKEHMVSHGMPPEKFVYIPNGIDLVEWQIAESLPEEHDVCIRKLKAQDKFIFGYTGTLGIANAISYFIEAADLLKDKQNLQFVIVGHGILEKELKSIARRKSLNNVTFLPSVQKKYIPMLLSQMDTLHIAAPRSSLYRFGISPNKLMEYMMAEKPIINAIDAGNDPVEETQCGISVSPEDPEAVAQAVLELMDMSEDQRREMGLRGRRYVMENHDYRVLAHRFLESI